MLKDIVSSVLSDMGSYTNGVGKLLNKEGWVDNPSDTQHSAVQADNSVTQSQYIDVMRGQYSSVVGDKKLREAIEKPIDIAKQGFSGAIQQVTDGFKNAGVDLKEAITLAENRPSVSDVNLETVQSDSDKSKAYFERARMAFEHGASDGFESDFNK